MQSLETRSEFQDLMNYLNKGDREKKTEVFESIDLHVVVAYINDTAFMLKDCPTPRFTTSFGNCSLLEKATAGRLAANALRVIKRDRCVPMVSGATVSTELLETCDSITELDDVAQGILSIVQIQTCFTDEALSQIHLAEENTTFRERLVRAFRQEVGIRPGWHTHTPYSFSL